MYPDHLQTWLDYGHALLIFLYLASFWLSETGQIWGLRAFPGERMGGGGGGGGNGPKYRLLMYADHVQNWLDYNNGLLFFLLILALFWLIETGQIYASKNINDTDPSVIDKVYTHSSQGITNYVKIIKINSHATHCLTANYYICQHAWHS